MTDRGDHGAGRPPLRESVASLLAALFGTVRTRLELASVEYAEERSRLGAQLALLIAGMACLLFKVRGSNGNYHTHVPWQGRRYKL